MVSKASSSSSLAPGFRFHPTDEELVRYYLRRKVCGKSFRFDAVSEIDIYKAEPWDLPGMAKLKTRDLEWYFFSVLDKKYGNGSRTNRATDRGYWKTTGKDRPVYHKSLVVGMKKTLVYHSGRAPKGQRSNWVMHEYRLIDEELQKAGIVQDAFVLCRVFQKSGSGPKNGEQYGAPFEEEEWEDEVGILPKEEAAEEVEVADDAYLDGNDLEQILYAEIPTDNVPLPLNCYAGEDATLVGGTAESADDSQKLSVGSEEYDYGCNQSDEQKPSHLPFQYNMHQPPVKHEFIGESSQTFNPQGMEYLLDEPYVDAADNFQFGDGAFLETNDLSNPIDSGAAGFDMLEEYLTFFDANGDIAFDPLTMEGGHDIVSGESSDAEKYAKEAIQPVTSSKELEHFDDPASSSKEECLKFESGFQYPFMKQASQMLGSLPAPPAFASEFPSKDVALHLNSASQPSSSAHVTAGMIQIRDMSMGRQGTDWFLGKQGWYNVTFSFGLSRGDDNSTTLESAVRILPGKNNSSASNSWFYFIFFWVLLLSVSFKIGTLICAQ